MERIIVLSVRNIKEILKDPISLIFTILLPLAMEILFYFIFHKLTSQFQMQYLAPGIVVFSQSFITLFIGLLISVDRSSSFLTRLFVSKTKSFEYIVSYILSMLPIIFIQSVLFFIIGGVIDNSLFKVEMIYCILLSIVTSLFFISIGLLFGCLFNEKSIGGVASIIISCQSVLSGMWFPIDNLDGGFIKIMNILPFKNATILLQNCLNGINNIYNDFYKPLLIVLTYSVLVFILAIVIFKRKMKSN